MTSMQLLVIYLLVI